MKAIGLDLPCRMNVFLIIIVVYEGQKVHWFDLRASKTSRLKLPASKLITPTAQEVQSSSTLTSRPPNYVR